MARTSLAARIRIDPSFSDGYESNHFGGLGGHNLSLAELRSPIEQMARTPTHVRFAELEPDQLVEIPVVSRITQDSELQTRQMVSMQLMEEQIRCLQDEIQEIRRILPANKILDRQSGERFEVRMGSSGLIAREESQRTAPLDMNTQHIVAASSNITSVESGNAPPTVMADRRVKISKYSADKH